MKKFSVYDWMSKVILEQDEEQPQQSASQSPPQPPPQQQQQQSVPSKSSNQAFRTIVGKTISGITYSPNGDSGGEIKIMVKDSYLPFKISWVNEAITVTDLNGNILNLGE